MGLLLILLWIALITYRFLKEYAVTEDNPSQKKFSYKSVGQDSKDYVISLNELRLMSAVMNANGTPSRSQLDIVKSYIRNNYTERSQLGILQAFKNMLNEKQNIQEVCKYLDAHCMYDKKKGILTQLFRVAVADGTYDYREQELLRMIAYFLKQTRTFITLNNKYTATQHQQRQSSSNWQNSSYQNTGSGSYGNSNGSSSGQSYQQIVLNRQKEAYKVLGLTSDATEDQIKKSYKKLVMQYHPDRQYGKTQNEVEEARSKFEKVQEAYNIIKEARGMK